jgi:hypothetical protein
MSFKMIHHLIGLKQTQYWYYTASGWVDNVDRRNEIFAGESLVSESGVVGVVTKVGVDLVKHCIFSR